jgi:tRNA pseudouridine55 synthase
VIQNLPELNGVLLVDKPKGWTSHDVVAKLRNLLQTRSAGHAGTLDPMATGLLVILLGKATKASQILMSHDKEYEGVMRLGQVTNTQDADGDIVETAPVPPAIDADAIAAALRRMEGDQYQTPPMFSAKKIQGVPLYKLARKGEDVPREPRFIHVARFELLSYSAPDAAFRVECSKGTYVRTLANDAGRAIGPGAHLVALRRTKSGDFNVADALGLDAIAAMPRGDVAARLIPTWKAVPGRLL